MKSFCGYREEVVWGVGGFYCCAWECGSAGVLSTTHIDSRSPHSLGALHDGEVDDFYLWLHRCKTTKRPQLKPQIKSEDLLHRRDQITSSERYDRNECFVGRNVGLEDKSKKTPPFISFWFDSIHNDKRRSRGEGGKGGRGGSEAKRIAPFFRQGMAWGTSFSQQKNVKMCKRFVERSLHTTQTTHTGRGQLKIPNCVFQKKWK